MSTKSTLSIVSILLKQNRFASAHLCGTRKQVFDVFTLMHEWLFHRLFKKAYKLSTCLKASRLWRRRIFGVLLETRHSPRPLSLCLQSAQLWAAARWYVRGLYRGFTNSLREHLTVPEYILPVCFRQVLKSPSGTLRAATFTRFILLRIELGKPFVFITSASQR